MDDRESDLGETESVITTDSYVPNKHPKKAAKEKKQPYHTREHDRKQKTEVHSESAMTQQQDPTGALDMQADLIKLMLQEKELEREERRQIEADRVAERKRMEEERAAERRREKEEQRELDERRRLELREMEMRRLQWEKEQADRLADRQRQQIELERERLEKCKVDEVSKQLPKFGDQDDLAVYLSRFDEVMV